jgi:hypothetical protein
MVSGINSRQRWRILFPAIFSVKPAIDLKVGTADVMSYILKDGSGRKESNIGEAVRTIVELQAH